MLPFFIFDREKRFRCTKTLLDESQIICKQFTGDIISLQMISKQLTSLTLRIKIKILWSMTVTAYYARD